MVERCVEDDHGRCETHDAAWPHSRPCCDAVDLAAFWAARR